MSGIVPGPRDTEKKMTMLTCVCQRECCGMCAGLVLRTRVLPEHRDCLTPK